MRRIVLGDALSSDIRTTFEPLLGKEATAIVAAFSLGGDKGMSMEAVAKEYRLNLVNVQQVSTGLAAGGVLTDVGQGRLAVRPPSLRFALIRDIFFCGATSIPCDGLIKQSPDITDTTFTLIEARARGANIPDNFLINLINQVNSSKVWEHFAYLGPNECNWLLDNHPDSLGIITDAALGYIPQRAIPLLLDQAIDDNRPLHSHPEHPIRKIEDWIKSAEPGTVQVIKRREILLDAALTWFAKSSDVNTALKAMQFVLSPIFSDGEISPGSQLIYTYRTGIVTRSEISIICRFWPHIMAFLKESTVRDWEPIFDLIHKWLYPGNVVENISNETKKSMRDFAVKIATDVMEINTKHPGILSRISRIFKQFDLASAIKMEPEFDILFPAEDSRREFQKMYAEQAAAAKQLAVKWLSQDVKVITERIARYELEARAAGITWPRWSALVAETIAEKVQNPSTWALALIEVKAESDLIIPFLKAASSESQEYPTLLKACLSKPELQFAGISAGLAVAVIPEGILPIIMSVLDDRYSNWIELECYRLHIPEDRVIALLGHTNFLVAAAAAIGEWKADPEGTIREALKEPWRVAIIKGLEHQYEGQEIFSKDPSIAYNWLELRVKDKRGFSYSDEKLRDTALEVINKEQRKSLLGKVTDDFWYSDVIHGIVDDELEVYQSLLANQKLKRFHLSPLAGTPNAQWIIKALTALDAGYSSENVAYAAIFEGIRTWSGNESSHWGQWVSSFEPLLAHDDLRVRDIGKFGQEYALAQKQKALARERLEDIYGR